MDFQRRVSAHLLVIVFTELSEQRSGFSMSSLFAATFGRLSAHLLVIIFTHLSEQRIGFKTLSLFAHLLIMIFAELSTQRSNTHIMAS